MSDTMSSLKTNLDFSAMDWDRIPEKYKEKLEG